MNPIRLVDLHTQYLHIQQEIDVAIKTVTDSCAFINGPAVKRFADQLSGYLDVAYVIPCANGTDALQIALMALGLEPGDEVITPSFTYVATTEVVALLRLKPVFVDVDPNHFCMDPGKLREAITPRTKAIIPVHLYGQCAPMESILAIATEHGIPVVEDTAQALGSNYIFSDKSRKKAGTLGAVGTTSFFPSKNLGCYGDGGALFTNDDVLAAKIRMIANHGQSDKYVFDTIGCNSRLDSIQAAVLEVKLGHLDSYLDARRKAAAFYDAAFETTQSISTPARAPWSDHGFHQYTLKLNGVDRDALMRALGDAGIPSNVYYPIPVHLQKAYGDYHCTALPVTEKLSNSVLSLPMHTELEENQLAFITEKVLAFCRETIAS